MAHTVFHYKPKNVCSRDITIEIVDGKIGEVEFNGGCDGNHQGISALVKGMTIDDVIMRLQHIRCGFRTTSCPDQLAEALKEFKENKGE